LGRVRLSGARRWLSHMGQYGVIRAQG
jgi:hypothetical protein